MLWFKRHPEFLRREAKELSGNSNYQEHYQKRDNLFISCGNVIVRTDKIFKYPVLFIYTNSTPYSPPVVFLLNDILSEDELDEISSLPLHEALKKAKNHVKFYNYRHQNPNGTLCLLELENLNRDRAEFYSANDIIKRVRDWFAAHSTGDFPPDSPEVELFAHFPNSDLSKRFIYTSAFLNDNLYQGEFYLAQLYSIPRWLFDREVKIYHSLVLDGKNEKDVHVGSFTDDSNMIPLPEGIDTPPDLIKKREILNKQIKAGNLIRGYWWEIEEEPSPFLNIDELAEIVGNGSLEMGYERLLDQLESEAKQLSDEIYIGIRYTGRSENKEWQFFKLEKGEVKNPPILADFDLSQLQRVLQNYTIKAIYSEKLHDDNFHLRNYKRAERNKLKQKAVNIIGCGALGSEVADTVNKGGVGKINLIDKDVIKVNNPVRHTVSLNRLGIPKVHALGENLRNHNPFNVVNKLFQDITSINLFHYVDKDSISVSSIANDNIEGYLNEQAVINNRVIFYSRALRGGKAARIFRVIPGKDACMHCMSIYSNESNGSFINIPTDDNLPTLTNECNNPIRPGSAADLKIISSITSRLVLDYLQGRQSKNKNHWIWFTEDIDGLHYDESHPFKLHSSFLPPHPECTYCQDVDPVKIKIKQEVLDLIKEEIRKNKGVETGGVLLGYWDDEGNFIVEFASDAGPNAVKKQNIFKKDVQYTQEFIDEKYSEYGEKAIYLGEWHSHTTEDIEPSNTDLKSLTDISNQKEYPLEKPIMIIGSPSSNISATVHPYNKSYYKAEHVIIE